MVRQIVYQKEVGLWTQTLNRHTHSRMASAARDSPNLRTIDNKGQAHRGVL